MLGAERAGAVYSFKNESLSSELQWRAILTRVRANRAMFSLFSETRLSEDCLRELSGNY